MTGVRRSLRRGRVLAAVAVLLLTLTACASGGWGFGGSGGSKINLTYALWDANEQVGYQQSIDVFEKAHPNIHVTIEQVPYNNYESKITAQYVSKNAPDVFWVNTPWIADWVKGGVLTDITQRVKDANIDLSQYYPSLVTLHENGNKLYGLPKDWDTIAYYYNKTYFDKLHVTPPDNLTWAPDGSGTFLPFLKSITTDTKGRTANDPNFDPNSVATYAMSATNDLQSAYGNYFAMNGGSILPAQYATTSSLNSPQNAEALTFLTKTLQAAHVVVPNAQTGPNGDSTNTTPLFSEGRMAMLGTGDWATSGIAKLASSSFKIGVMTLPSGPQGRISVFNGLTDGIVSNTPHPNEAWELVQWLASADSQKILGSGGYVWPAIPSLDPLFQNYWKGKGVDVTPFLEEAQGKTVTFPVATGLAEALNNVTTSLGPTFLGSASVDSGLKSATKILNYRISYGH
jgi:multiple sugar transport system substrate-binding protein